MSESPDDRLMTTAEVADYCQVSQNTVIRWRFDGDLAFHRLGARTIRHRRDDVDAMLANRRTDAFDPAQAPVSPVEASNGSSGSVTPAGKSGRRVAKKAPAKRAQSRNRAADDDHR